MPETVAPNLITLVAFIIIVASHVVFMFWGDSTFTKALEPWKYLLFGVTLFLYQHLDNLDGKQARKTSNDKLTQKTPQLWGCFLITAAMLFQVCWWASSFCGWCKYRTLR